MNKILGLIKFILMNFGPLVGFYLFNHFFGTRAGIYASLAITVFEIVRFRIRRESMSSLFKVSATLSVVFGLLDLYLKNPFFFKLEAPFLNLFFAGYFGITLLKRTPRVLEFAIRQKRTDSNLDPDKLFYFQFQTFLWTVYFALRALVYLWINFNTSIEGGLGLRLLVGKLSMLVMFGLSIGLSKRIWRVLVWLKWMPSTRQQPQRHSLMES